MPGPFNIFGSAFTLTKVSIGLGESYPNAEAEAAIVHSRLAAVLLGQDPSAIDKLWADMFLAVSYSGWAGAEMRAISAVDIALWDLAGKVANQPIYKLLGRGIASVDSSSITPVMTMWISMREPVRLARELLNSNIHAMKIWPFDPIAKETSGNHISAAQIEAGHRASALDSRKIWRRHRQLPWSSTASGTFPRAIKIAQALEPYQPMWLEEMLPQDNLASYADLARGTILPLCVSERLMTRWGFRELFENRAARIIMPDICWCGGISEGEEDRHHGGDPLSCRSLRIIAVDPCCTMRPHIWRPMSPIFIFWKRVRRHYLEEYEGLVTQMLVPKNGELPLPSGPGLGVELSEKV